MEKLYASYTVILLAAGFILLIGADMPVTGMITGESEGDVGAANFWGLALICCGMLSFFFWKAELQRRGVDLKSPLGKALVETIPPDRKPLDGIEQKIVSFAKEPTGTAYSTGSTVRDTYIPDEKGMPNDIDIYVPNSAQDISGIVNDIEYRKSDLEENISREYGRQVELVRTRSKTKKDPKLKQVFYQVRDKRTGEKIVNIDFNYSADPSADSYNIAFASQLHSIIRDLPEEDKQFAVEYLKGNIRAVKKIMGGVKPGILAEQMVMGRQDGRYTSIEKLMKDFSAGNAMKSLYRGYVPHPVTGKNLAEEANHEKLRSRISGYNRYIFRPRTIFHKAGDYIKQIVPDYSIKDPAYSN